MEQLLGSSGHLCLSWLQIVSKCCVCFLPVGNINFQVKEGGLFFNKSMEDRQAMEGKRDNEEKGQGGHEERDLCGQVSVKGG